jgi:uncharacterized membrane protein required for colicin V production
MLMLLAVSILQRFGDLIVGGVVLALVAFGVQNGLFLAVLTGMQALLALVFALAFADPLASLLTTFELPIVYAFPAAFGLLLVGTAVATRLVMGGYVSAEVVRFAPIIDKLGGALVGAVAGIILAGTLLIACSIAPVPEAFRLDGSTLGYDMGTRMLRTFARCVEPDDAKRVVLLDGEPGSVPEPSPGVAPAVLDAADTKGNAVAPPPPRWSEPFADLNGNKQQDDGEPYLDTDRDKAFTARLVVNDPNANGKRDIGLLERYRLHAWGRHVISVVALNELTAVQAAAGTPATESAPAAKPSAAGASRPAK